MADEIRGTTATVAVSDPDEPLTLFSAWLEEATHREPDLATAMTLATVGRDGRPSARMVLLKDLSRGGFVFYTNLESRKAVELAGNAHAALLFHWKSLRRQVRAEGAVEKVTEAEADAYFVTRPRGAQIGAWASHQSRPLESRFALEKNVAALTTKFGLGEIPRPGFWSGFRLIPDHIEFWQDRPFRLHDRLVFHRGDDGWRREKLYP